MLTEWLVAKPADQVQAGFDRFAELLDQPDRPEDPGLENINVSQAVGRFPSRRSNPLLLWPAPLNALAKYLQ